MLRRYKIGDVKKKQKERKINSILDINRLIKNILILNVKLYKRSKKTYREREREETQIKEGCRLSTEREEEREAISGFIMKGELM